MLHSDITYPITAGVTKARVIREDETEDEDALDTQQMLDSGLNEKENLNGF